MWRTAALVAILSPHGVVGLPPFTIVRTSRTQKLIYKRGLQSKALEDQDQQVPKWLVKCADDAPAVEAGVCQNSGCQCTVMGGVGLLLAECEESKLVDLVDARPELGFAEEDGDAGIRLEPQGDAVPLYDPNATFAPTWNLKRIGLSNDSATGKGVRIWVVDTGVRATHNDLKGRVTSMGRFLPEKDGGEGPCESNADERCFDDIGHGTHVAGTAAGSRFGVARDAEVLAIKVFRGETTPTTTQLIKALHMIFDNRQPGDVVNLSLGAKGVSPAMAAALASLKKGGLHVIAAAGNSAEDACTGFIAREDSVFTIGASNVHNQRAKFSNWGECVDLFAPGVRIAAAGHDADDLYYWQSGTSMAAPHVAGVAALYLESRKSAEPEEVRDFLTTTAAEGKLMKLKAGDPNRLLHISTELRMQADITPEMGRGLGAPASLGAASASKEGQGADISSLRGSDNGRKLGDGRDLTSGGVATARPSIAQAVLIALCAFATGAC